MSQVNAATVKLIMVNEGCVLHSYEDVAGKLTIGYGHTGLDVHFGQTITLAQAQQLLQQDLDKFSNGVSAAIKTSATADNQFGSMTSLAYNIGLGDSTRGFRSSSVLRDHLAGNYQAAADAFLLWNKAGGRVIAGLIRRRHEERALYLKSDTISLLGATVPMGDLIVIIHDMLVNDENIQLQVQE